MLETVFVGFFPELFLMDELGHTKRPLDPGELEVVIQKQKLFEQLKVLSNFFNLILIDAFDKQFGDLLAHGKVVQAH
jgi:hypothetical protein